MHDADQITDPHRQGFTRKHPLGIKKPVSERFVGEPQETCIKCKRGNQRGAKKDGGQDNSRFDPSP